jgi:hypothetical protein
MRLLLIYTLLVLFLVHANAAKPGLQHPLVVKYDPGSKTQVRRAPAEAAAAATGHYQTNKYQYTFTKPTFQYPYSHPALVCRKLY